MNKEDILRMALAAGVLAGYEGEPDNLIRFAAIVAAAEREMEREACAKLCEESVESDWHNQDNIDTAYDCAAAIRERGNT